MAGGLIGLNRESIHRAAGFRTHMLICMGSCLIMLISIYIPQEYSDYKGGDPGRIASQVVTGIGFLGAGAIIKLGDHIKGLTTAASIWVSAAIGLAIGAGMLWVSLAATIFVLIALIAMEKLSRVIFNKKSFKSLILQIDQPNFDLALIEKMLKQHRLRFEIVLYHHNTTQGFLDVEFLIAVPVKFNMENFLNKLSVIPNLKEVSVKSNGLSIS
ncbi:MAG: MgtC/SapB family protein [Bacteroidales bacterium]|nr:MgtC/SapB family protein [Bacteroidales bacterium]